MRHLHAPAFASLPLLLSLGACGSDSGGGGCQNLSGTYHATTMTCASTGDTKVVQTGCSATITTGQGDTLTGTVAGNKFTSPDVSCTVTISGPSYITDCTQKDTTGKSVTCHETGDVADRPAQSGAGGSGGASAAGGASGNTGGTTNNGAGGSGGPGGSRGSGGAGGPGGSSGSGGSGGSGGTAAQCGVSWSDVPSCDTCMNTSCCTELQSCGPGTDCGAFLACVSTSCSSGDATCIQTQCSNELQAAASDVSALSDCNAQQCQGCQ